MSSVDTIKTCGICRLKTASYTCPRCNTPYCSSDCYKNLDVHSECSESFYQEQVMAELKTLNIDDIESKTKMINILKNEATKLGEDDEIYDLEKDLDIYRPEKETVKEDDLIKEYLNEIKNWRPWWHGDEFKKSLLITSVSDQDDLFDLNERLVENSKILSINNSSQFLYNEILKCFYLYQLCFYIYQLTLDDFNNKIDLILFEEICNNFLELDSILSKRVPKGLNIRQEFETIVSVLLEEQSYFLKVYINKKFLLNLIDELVQVQRSSKTQVKIISNLYDLFQITSRVNKKDEHVSKPMNVFHVNKERNVKTTESGNSRVKIVRPDDTLKSNEKLDSKYSKREYKLFLKKLEFYFKWLIVNKASVVNVEACGLRETELNHVKAEFETEMEQFKSDKDLIEQNLNKLRTKSKLIEEI